jgi:hypothetical protein
MSIKVKVTHFEDGEKFLGTIEKTCFHAGSEEWGQLPKLVFTKKGNKIKAKCSICGKIQGILIRE